MWLCSLKFVYIIKLCLTKIYNYEGESIIIPNICFIFIKAKVEILQLRNFST
jgi:hypothetical protein